MEDERNRIAEISKGVKRFQGSGRLGDAGDWAIQATLETF
jgi:hypothetical protein